MNNDLEQFSEERLNEIAGGGFKSTAKFDEQMALARIALAAKQAKPVVNAEFKDGWPVINMMGVINGSEKLSDGFHDLYTTPQPAHTEKVIPDGWKLVPIEPTEAMCDVKHIGVDVFDNQAEDGESYSIGGEYAAKVYRAMLAAAPKPESE